MFNPPLLPGMPDFHDSLEYLRHTRNLSRESTAHKAGISASHLNQIIGKRKTPGPSSFDRLARFFDLSPAQRRHLEDLLQPSLDLPSPDELRRSLTEQSVHTHLAHLDQRDILGAYFDPLQTVLHGNEMLDRMMPGLDKVEHNLVRWLLTPTARERVEDWHGQLIYSVSNLRAVLGRYRDAPRAQELFQSLRTDIAFRDAWDSTALQVTYHWTCSTPIRLRIPGLTRPISLHLEVEQYGASSELFIVHGLYTASALAS